MVSVCVYGECVCVSVWVGGWLGVGVGVIVCAVQCIVTYTVTQCTLISIFFNFIHYSPMKAAVGCRNI